MRGTHLAPTNAVSADGRLCAEFDPRDMAAVLRFRYIPPSSLAVYDIRSELGLDYLLYIQALVNEDES
jgi:hypothetical protein